MIEHSYNKFFLGNSFFILEIIGYIGQLVCTNFWLKFLDKVNCRFWITLSFRELLLVNLNQLSSIISVKRGIGIRNGVEILAFCDNIVTMLLLPLETGEINCCTKFLMTDYIV